MVDDLEVHDFSGSPVFPDNYDGSAAKAKILYEGDLYLMKYGKPLTEREKRPSKSSYRHSAIAEYIGSHVFGLLGFEAQDTLLGYYTTPDGVEHEVVACRDFMEAEYRNDIFVPFENILQNPLSGGSKDYLSRAERNRIDPPELKEIIDTLDQSSLLRSDPAATKKYFWDMFVVDMLIGNFDRNANNWAYLAKRGEETVYKPAPVYDCASSLRCDTDSEQLASLAVDKNWMRQTVLTVPRTSFLVGGDRRPPQEFMVSDLGSDARSALVALAPAIQDLLKSYPFPMPEMVTDDLKLFTTAYIDTRAELILQPALDLASREHDIEPITLKPVRSLEECGFPTLEQFIREDDDSREVWRYEKDPGVTIKIEGNDGHWLGFVWPEDEAKAPTPIAGDSKEDVLLALFDEAAANASVECRNEFESKIRKQADSNSTVGDGRETPRAPARSVPIQSTAKGPLIV